MQTTKLFSWFESNALLGKKQKKKKQKEKNKDHERLL